MPGPTEPTRSDALADWLGADEAVEPAAGDRFREAQLALAETEARARIVELHRGGHVCRVEDIQVADAGDTDWTRRSVEWSSRPCRTMRLLAAPYWGWPGWRDEWSV